MAGRRWQSVETHHAHARGTWLQLPQVVCSEAVQKGKLRTLHVSPNLKSDWQDIDMFSHEGL